MIDKKLFYDIADTDPDNTSNLKQFTTNHNVAKDARVNATPFANKITQGEIKMADPATQADLAALERNVDANFYATRGDIKDTRHDIIDNTESVADRITDQATQFYIASQQNANEAARDLASLKVLTDMNASAMREAIALNIEKQGAAAQLSAEKIATAVALGQSTLSKEIFADGQKTRDLINDLKYHDLNRALVERNAELVDERHSRRHWRHAADQGQWQALQSQLQAFQSQLQETRQGMVNFGTMAGVGQTSTSNNVR